MKTKEKIPKPVPQAMTRDEYRQNAYRMLGYTDQTYGAPAKDFTQLVQHIAVKLFMTAEFGEKAMATETRRRLKQLQDEGFTDE